MPFTLVVQLLNGLSFSYTVRPRLGKAAWITHQPRLTEIVCTVLDLPQDQYTIQFIFGDEELRLSEIIQRYQLTTRPEDVMKLPSSYEYNIMDIERYITQDYIIYALAEPRPHDPLVDSLQLSFQQALHLLQPSADLAIMDDS